MLAADVPGYVLVAVPSGVIVAALGTFVYWRRRRRQGDKGREEA